MSAPTRFLLTIELNAAPGETAQDAVEWIQKSFDYYHPRLAAKVVKKAEVKAVDAPPLIDQSLL